MKNLLYLTGVLLFTITTTYAQDCDSNEDARRYLVRAKAAFNEAKSDADFLNVVEEYKKALQFAPDCIDIYYNIAACYDKSASSGLVKDIWGCGQAMEYYKKYLELKPDAQNKQAVQNRIYELEYKKDKLYEKFPFIGKYKIGHISTNLDEFEIKTEDNKIIAIVPQNNMGIKFDTLEVGNYLTKEGQETLTFCQKQYAFYYDTEKIKGVVYENKSNKFNTKNYLEYSNICYSLKFRKDFAFVGYILQGNNVNVYKNGKNDVMASLSMSGVSPVDGSPTGYGFTGKDLTADKITKIEPDTATEPPVPTQSDSDKKEKTPKKKGTSLGSSLFGR